MGCATYPDELIYSMCPICGEQTDRFSNAGSDMLSKEEAELLLLKSEFEKYYERRCVRRGIPVDGDLPDDYEPYEDAIRSEA